MKKLKQFKGEAFTILFQLVMFLAVAGGVAFMIFLLVTNNNAIADLERNSKLEGLRAQEYARIQQEFSALGSDGLSNEFATLLPKEEEFVNVIKELEFIAELSGSELAKNLGNAYLTEEGLFVEDPDAAGVSGSSDITLKGDGYAILQITGSLKTDFVGLLQFLNLLEQSQYFINIDNLTVSRLDLEDEPDKLDVRLVLNVYVSEIIGL